MIKVPLVAINTVVHKEDGTPIPGNWSGLQEQVQTFTISHNKSFKDFGIKANDYVYVSYENQIPSDPKTYFVKIKCYANPDSKFLKINSGMAHMLNVTNQSNSPLTLSDLTSTTTSVSFNWSNSVPFNQQDIKEFEIYRSTSGGNFSRIATVSATRTNYTDENLSANTEYEYYVIAVHVEGVKTNKGNDPYKIRTQA